MYGLSFLKLILQVSIRVQRYRDMLVLGYHLGKILPEYLEVKPYLYLPCALKCMNRRLRFRTNEYNGLDVPNTATIESSVNHYQSLSGN